MTGAGIVVVDKPAGITSHGVVAALRRILGTRKVGHAGTLDPMATGVLIVGVERATRLLGHLALHDKDYLATIRLGATTVTDDVEGEVLQRADATALAEVSDEAIRAGACALTGAIQQVPTRVSAVKIAGERAHRLVRAGVDVDLAARPVEVAKFDIGSIVQGPDGIDVEASVTCSTGTYVRALARDLGASLGVGGHLAALRRTRVGPFTVGEATPLEELQVDTDPGAHLLTMGEIARRCFPVRVLSSDEADHVRHGRPVVWLGADGVTALLSANGDLLALAEPKDGRASYLAVLAE